MRDDLQQSQFDAIEMEKSQVVMRHHILFVHNAPTRFVTIDRELLSERYEVIDWYERTHRINLPKLAKAVLDADLVFCWFASWHSLAPALLARLLKKPSVVIVGGYDTANLPEAGYGSQRGGIQRWITRTVMRNATQLITNSHSAKTEALTNVGAKLPSITVIYHGIPQIIDDFLPIRERRVITVGSVWRENLLRKGLLPFVQTACLLPEENFVHAGSWPDSSIDDLRREAGANVSFRGQVSDDELYALYSTSKVYVQCSLHEGFGMSLAEAMSGGCIPVVTRLGSIPEVVGDTGVYTESNRPKDIANAIRLALTLDAGAGLRARERVLTLFPLERRRHALFELLDSLLKQESESMEKFVGQSTSTTVP